ncbi:MAG: metallophosphoesterase, partial [Gammaproteobacteria bacterium]|nr:metallophosphoesterase [Gammaproteobacteria bacterium]
RLEQAREGQLKLVVVHQPVAVTRPEDQANLLHGREQAVKRWAQAGADLVLGGHIHLPYVMPLGPETAGVPQCVWCIQAGTATSSRVRAGAPNSVNLIRHPSLASTPSARQCTVERWDFAAGSNEFERHQEHVLALSSPSSPGATPAPRQP